MTVSGNKDYTFGGTGSLDGLMAITKSGAGRLTLATANTYTGGTSVNGGTLAMGNANGAGSGPISLDNAAYVLGALNVPNALIISGTNSVTGNGGGKLGAMTGNGTANLTVTSGVLDLAGSQSAFTGTIAINGNNPVRFNGSTGGSGVAFDLGNGSAAMSVRSSAAAIDLGALQGGAGTTLAGQSNSDAATTFTIGAKNLPTTYAGVITNGTGGTAALSSIVKAGTATLTLSGPNTYGGGTEVIAGALVVSGSGKLGTGNLAVSAGATCGITATGNALADTAAVALAPTAILNLGSSVDEAVGLLMIGGVIQEAGIWNATRDPVRFSGTGQLRALDGIAAAPTGLSASSPAPDRITLAWTDRAINESGYAVERQGPGESGFSALVTLPAGATSYTDTGLTGASVYSYRVRALATLGNSAFTLPATATTLPPPGDGIWLNPAGGNWSTYANWRDYTRAGGPDKSATINLATAVTVTQDAPSATIGHLFLANANHNIQGNPLVLDVSTGTPQVNVGTASTATIAAAIGGNDGLSKTGQGALVLSGANTYTGVTTVKDGALTLAGARTAASSSMVVSDTSGTHATLDIADGIHAITGGSITVGAAGGSPATGTLNQTGGAVSFAGGNQLFLGTRNGTTANTGIYNLSGGSLATSASTTRGVILGANSTTTGTFNLSGSGSLQMTTGGNAILMLGRSDTATSNSTATFNQTGGTAAIGILAIGGNGATGSGLNATLSLTGGTFSANQFTLLAAGPSNTATITIGGSAQVTMPAFPSTRGSSSDTTITFNSTTGFLSPPAQSATYLGGFTRAYLTANGAKFNVGNGNDITISQNFENAAGQAGTLAKSGAGQLTLTGSNTHSGGTAIHAGTLAAAGALALGTGPVTNNATLNLTAGAVTYTGLSTSLAGNGTLNVTLGTGTGSTLLNGNHAAFTGLWNIGTDAPAGAGKVQMNGPDNAAATIHVLSNATLFTNSGTHAAAVTLHGGNTGESLGQLRVEGGATWSGPITLAGDITGSGDATIGALSGAGTGTISGAVGQSGGPRVLSKAGGSTIILTTANTYSGGTNVAAGTLTVSGAGTFGGGNLTVANAATASILATAGAIADNADILLTGSGKVNLGPGVSESVARLFIDGELQIAGTWNAARSPANITGSGELRVLDGIAATPDGLSATAASASSITLGWTDNATNESAYIVERSTTAGGGFSQVATLPAGATGFTDTGLLPGTTYFHRVRALAGAGNSAYSEESSATTPWPPPGNGTWANAAGGNWSAPANWLDAVVAGGAGKSASITMATAVTITQDAPSATIGHLFLANANHNIQGNPLTLDADTGSSQIDVASGTDTTLSLPVAGNDGLTKTGAGSLTMSGANTHTGLTSVLAGTLTLLGNHAAATGGLAVNITNSANATLNIGASSQLTPTTLVVTTGKYVQVGGAGGTGYEVLNARGAAAFPTTVTNHGNLLAARNSSVFLGSHTDWTQHGPLEIRGVGGYGASVSISSAAALDYAAATPIALNPGTNAVGSATLTVSGMLTTRQPLAYGTPGGTGAFARISLANGGKLVLGANIAQLATGHAGGQFQLESGGGVLDTSGHATTLAIGITNASGQSGALAKHGNGTLTLAGTCTYTGATTVTAGTLAVTGSLGATAVEVRDGACLAGNGNLGGSLTIQSGGRHALAVAATPAAQSTRFITGTLTLATGNLLDLTAAAPPAPGTYVLATATGGISGTPHGVSVVGLAGVASVVGNSLVFTVPEPGFATWLLDYPDLADKSPHGDPDNDGVGNLLEYVLAGDPRVRDNAILPAATLSGNELVFTFSRLASSSNHTSQFFQHSGNLSLWTDIPLTGTIGPGVTIGTPVNGRQSVTIRVSTANAVGGETLRPARRGKRAVMKNQGTGHPESG